MKFIKMVKNIFSEFNKAKERGVLTPEKIKELQRKIDLVVCSFNPQLSDYEFKLQFELYQPKKDLVQELQDTGRHSLITKNPFDFAEQERIKNEYKLVFRVEVFALIEDLTFEMDDNFDYLDKRETLMRRAGTSKYDHTGYYGSVIQPRYRAWFIDGQDFLHKYMKNKKVKKNVQL